MIYKYHMFQLYPYGALINVMCEDGLHREIITEYSTPTNYTMGTATLGYDNSYFIESSKEPVEMTYRYKEVNGALVEIITNLEIKNYKRNKYITKISEDPDGTKHYKVDHKKTDGTHASSGRFIVSNVEAFNNGNTIKPYIKLCFNEVLCEACFGNPWAGPNGTYPAGSPKQCDNGWDYLYITDYDYGPNIPKENSALHLHANEDYYICTLPRYYRVSWNKPETLNIFDDDDMHNDTMYQFWFAYGKKDGTIVFPNDWTTKAELLSRRFFSHSNDTVHHFNFSVEIPPLNGTGIINVDPSLPSIVPYNFFQIVYTVNQEGCSGFKNATKLKLSNIKYIYDKKGFITKVPKNTEIDKLLPPDEGTLKFIPTFLNNDNCDSYVWSDSSLFYQISEDQYISPADGFTITPNWCKWDGYTCSCDGDEGCNCNGKGCNCDGDEGCECDGHTNPPFCNENYSTFCTDCDPYCNGDFDCNGNFLYLCHEIIHCKGFGCDCHGIGCGCNGDGCNGDEDPDEHYIEVTARTRGEFWIKWEGKDYLCNCRVAKGDYDGYELSGGGALIYGDFSGQPDDESVRIYGPFYSSECSITSDYVVH